MTKKNVRIAGVVMPVMIAMLLLFAGSSRVTARDQPSAANVAVKIDNLFFGPPAITVPVGTTVTWTNSDDVPTKQQDMLDKAGEGAVRDGRLKCNR
jgi:plastocyanin